MDVNTCFDHENYEILAEIGEGAYGKVYKAREVRDRQRLVAVKKLNVGDHDPDSHGIPAFMIREVALLRKIDHPNIVKLLDVSAGRRGRGMDLTLVFEYIDQDLSTFLTTVPNNTGLSLDKIKDVMTQLLRGVDYLHINMLVHRDLKPDNILVSSRGEVKIADFGLARIYTYRIALTPGVVTLWYRAPEVLLNCSYMSSVDMWSAGCIFAELFLLRPLFCGNTEFQQLQKIFEVIGMPIEEHWPKESPIPYCPNDWAPGGPCTKPLSNLGQDETSLLFQCLTFNPASRPSACKALAHRFLTGA